jgi:hypothetical protein
MARAGRRERHQPPPGLDVGEDGVRHPVHAGEVVAPAPGEAEQGRASPSARGGGERQQSGEGEQQHGHGVHRRQRQGGQEA